MLHTLFNTNIYITKRERKVRPCSCIVPDINVDKAFYLFFKFYQVLSMGQLRQVWKLKKNMSWSYLFSKATKTHDHFFASYLFVVSSQRHLTFILFLEFRKGNQYDFLSQLVVVSFDLKIHTS